MRRVEGEGGFATVLAKGEPDAGTLIIVIGEKGRDFKAFERMPRPDGQRAWTLSQEESAEEPGKFQEWIARRRNQDPDLWIVELDVPQGERFIGKS